MKMIRAFCFTRPGLAALLFFLLGVTIPEQAFALPELRSVSFSPLTNDDGTASCWKGRWSFRLGENPGGSKNWGYEVKRNGVYTHRFAPREREYRREALVELDSPVHPIAGVEQHVQFRTYDGEGNFGPWSEPLSYKYPRCDGLEHDGRGHTDAYVVLVGFADSDRDAPPFSPEDVARELFAPTGSGVEMTWPQFLRESFNGDVEDHTKIHPTWVYLAKRLDEYSAGTDPAFGGEIHPLYLQNTQIRRAVVEKLALDGLDLTKNRLYLILGPPVSSGIAYSSVGFSVLGLSSAISSGPPKDRDSGALLHESGHLFGLEHSGSILECEGRMVPSSFLVEPEDRDCSPIEEYGVGAMGNFHSYGGFSGLDRIYMGLLDFETSLEVVHPSEGEVVGVYDLDSPTSPAWPKIILFDEEFLREVLPSNISLFVEYSNSSSLLREDGAVRIGLFWNRQFVLGPNSRTLTESFRGNNSTMKGTVYFPEAFLNDPGDVVELEGLKLRVRLLSESDRYAMVQFERYDPECLESSPRYGFLGSHVEGSTEDGYELIYELEIENRNKSCGPSTFGVRASVSIGGKRIEKVESLVVSSERKRKLRVNMPLGIHPPGLEMKTDIEVRSSSSEPYSTIWESVAGLYATGGTLRLNRTVFWEGEMVYAWITNTGERPAELRSEVVSVDVDPPSFFAEPVSTYLVAPGKSTWVPLGRIAAPFPDTSVGIRWKLSDESRVLDEGVVDAYIQETSESCRDGVKNHGEITVDCGGTSDCGPCAGSFPVPAPTLGHFVWVGFVGLLGTWVIATRRRRFSP